MKILLSWKWRGPEMIDALEDAGHSVVYHIGIVRKEKHPGVFHDKRKAQRGILPDCADYLDFPPPNKELIEKLRKVESIVLTMMNRRESDLVVDERRHIYYDHLGYWNYVLDKYKIEAIVFDDVPHAVNTFVLYSLAKMRGVKTIMCQKVRIADRFLVFTDWEKGSVALSDKIREYKDKNFSIEDLSTDTLTTLGVGESEVTKPLYQGYFPDRKGIPKIVASKLRTAVLSLKDGGVKSLILTKYRLYKKMRMIRGLIKKYNSLTKTPNWNNRFIYVPLHYQPERTTCPQGGVYVDQILMIKTLSAALSDDWKIYVKEHPAQWHPSRIQSLACVRYPSYYEDLSKIPNVELISTDTDFSEPIARSTAVATVTGSAGLESIFRGKPVIVFGLPWYKDHPHVFNVSDVNSCREALKEISQGFVISKQANINFLKAFEDVSVRAYINFKSFVGTGSKLKEVESMNNLAAKIITELANTTDF